MAAQLNLHLGHRAAMAADDFLVADSNAHAVAWIDRWPDWPAPALVLYGPAGCGKSHLAQVWRARSGGPVLPAGLLAGADPLALLGGRPVCAVERPDLGVQELNLLHLYNVIAERRGSLLLLAETPPRQWRLMLPDLRSRLLAAPTAAVLPPDEALLGAVIAKLFADRQLQVQQDVIDHLLRNIERTFEAARAAVAAIDDASLAGRRRITPALAREVLARQRPRE